jgi:hypothetical protein
MKDPALWLVREEERIGFETKYILHDGKPTPLACILDLLLLIDVPSVDDKLSHDVVESFAILVPSTNYPPAFDISFGSTGEIDVSSTNCLESFWQSLNIPPDR